MKIDKLNLDGKKGTIEVLDKIFSAKINKRLINLVLYKTNANYKGRHAKTKQQNEVSGPTSKIYAQKGTGNARHASRKAPIFVGGGIAQIKKTKEMSKLVKKFELIDSLIILDKSSKDKIEKSIRNIPNIKVTDVNHFSAFDVIKFDKIVFTESSIKELEKRYL